jgi:hypothetical protein
VADDPAEAGTWGVATGDPRIVAASSGGTVRGGAVSGLGGYAAARHLLDRMASPGGSPRACEG